MSADVESAIITTVGALCGTILTLYFNVVRRPQVQPLDGPIDIQPAPQLVQKAALIEQMPLERDASLPFDSTLTFLTTPDQTIIKLPRPSGLMFRVAFLAGWLVAWTAGIYVACLSTLALVLQPGPKHDWFGILFMSGWLIAAIAAEFAATNALFQQVLKILGGRYLIASANSIVDMTYFFFLSIPKVYFRKFTKNFRAEADGLVFEYGKHDIKIDGITRVEAEWVRSHLLT